MRLFVGIPIQGTAQAALAAFLARATREAPGPRWEAAEALHLTLQFIGAWRDEDEGDLMSALAACPWRPFRLQLRGLGAFPSWRRPRVIWAGAAPSEDLNREVEAVATSLSKLGIAREARAYTPHVSLARVGNTGDTRRLNALRDAIPPTWGDLAVDRFCLFQTVAEATPANRYQVRGSFPTPDSPATQAR